jgi:hypothetical protein
MGEKGNKNEDAESKSEIWEAALQILQKDCDRQYDKNQSDIEPGSIALFQPIEERARGQQ